jgi:hypothetical protein
VRALPAATPDRGWCGLGAGAAAAWGERSGDAQQQTVHQGAKSTSGNISSTRPHRSHYGAQHDSSSSSSSSVIPMDLCTWTPTGGSHGAPRQLIVSDPYREAIVAYTHDARRGWIDDARADLQPFAGKGQGSSGLER